MTVAVGVTSFATARVLVPISIRNAPRSTMRTNVSGSEVPSILGLPLVTGTLAGLAVAGASREVDLRTSASAVALVVVTAAGGWFDDGRGDEPVRGFKGHLRAIAGGRLTGGGVKMLVGGLGAAAVGRALVPENAVRVGLGTALAANLANLLDRAPGRALKVAVAAAGSLLATRPSVRPLAAASLGASLACAPADLGERGMLGDAGANPVGALSGLTAGLASSPRMRVALVAGLAAANLASERWSFSRVIGRVGWLRALDNLGRERAPNPPAPC